MHDVTQSKAAVHFPVIIDAACSYRWPSPKSHHGFIMQQTNVNNVFVYVVKEQLTWLHEGLIWTHF